MKLDLLAPGDGPPFAAAVLRRSDLLRPLAGPDEPCAGVGEEPPGEAPQEAISPAAPEPASAVAAALAAIEAARRELEDRAAMLEARCRADSAAALARILSAAAPAICEAAARDAIASVFGEERAAALEDGFAIAASPDLRDVLFEECARRTPPIPVEVDESLAAGALRIRWTGGGLDCDVGRSLAAILECLSSRYQPLRKEEAS